MAQDAAHERSFEHVPLDAGLGAAPTHVCSLFIHDLIIQMSYRMDLVR